MTRFPLGLLLSLIVVLSGLLVGCGSSESSGPVGDVSLPADFPLNEVPLLNGRLIQATGTRAEGWSLTVQGEYGGPNVFDSAVSKLEKAGYAESSRTGDGGTRTAILSRKHDGATYWVTVASSPSAAGGPNSVFYQVSLG